MGTGAVIQQTKFLNIISGRYHETVGARLHLVSGWSNDHSRT